MLKTIVPGKLYKNTLSTYHWDEIVCPVEVNDKDSSGYVEYYYLARPNRGVFYTIPQTAKNSWEEINEY